MATQISKKRKFVADGVFYAELNEVLTRELAEDGYSGVEVRVTPMRTEIIIRATRTQNVLGEKGRRIRELTSVVQKRFKFPENGVELYAEKVNNRGLCAIAQAESLRYKLLGGLAVRRACYGVLRFVMESGAKGCEVIVSGKLRAQRAKSMKFKDGYMISSGQPVKEYIDSAVRHVLLRQGVLGIKVKIMLDWDPKGKVGPMTPLPDLVTIHPPKEEEDRGGLALAAGEYSVERHFVIYDPIYNLISNGFANKLLPELILPSPEIFEGAWIHKRAYWMIKNEDTLQANVVFLVKVEVPADRAAKLMVSQPRTSLHTHDRMIHAVSSPKGNGS
ncbi:40S ribosomal protein S3-3 [Populus alba x Populus x berolinensis]|uniref:40S ribosomal protein S3-3 n=1 Tax=Populus alba x Populus x berolinensis TaxID=444605 RepID=A0AAD6M1Y3_9ROSI|nr:40S ribosomal protein S3-3 [Populus alba x Populus x berolinensis]